MIFPKGMNQQAPPTSAPAAVSSRLLPNAVRRRGSKAKAAAISAKAPAVGEVVSYKQGRGTFVATGMVSLMFTNGTGVVRGMVVSEGTGQPDRTSPGCPNWMGYFANEV